MNGLASMRFSSLRPMLAIASTWMRDRLAALSVQPRAATALPSFDSYLLAQSCRIFFEDGPKAISLFSRMALITLVVSGLSYTPFNCWNVYPAMIVPLAT